MTFESNGGAGTICSRRRWRAFIFYNENGAEIKFSTKYSATSNQAAPITVLARRRWYLCLRWRSLFTPWTAPYKLIDVTLNQTAPIQYFPGWRQGYIRPFYVCPNALSNSRIVLMHFTSFSAENINFINNNFGASIRLAPNIMINVCIICSGAFGRRQT